MDPRLLPGSTLLCRHAFISQRGRKTHGFDQTACKNCVGIQTSSAVTCKYSEDYGSNYGCIMSQGQWRSVTAQSEREHSPTVLLSPIPQSCRTRGVCVLLGMPAEGATYALDLHGNRGTFVVCQHKRLEWKMHNETIMHYAVT